MARPSREDRIVAEGSFGVVEYAMRDDGSMEAKDWFDAQDSATQKSFTHLFHQLVDHRLITNHQRFKQLRGDVYEFKKHFDGKRLFCYRHANRWLLTHGAKKAGGIGKCKPEDIDHAEMIGKGQVAREAAEARRGRGK